MCQTVTAPGGGTMIVCGGHSRKRCSCGRRADRLCDWKVEGKRSGTCDAPICSRCSTKPAPEKDLCATHAIALEEWRASIPENRRTADGVR